MLATAALLGSASACATLSQEELDAGLSSLRAELTTAIEDGDATNARATSALDQRLSRRIEGVESRLEEFSRDVGGLERDFGARVERLETSMRFNVPVYFGYDAAEVTAEASTILDRFRAVADEHYPSAVITVEGLTDPAGDPAYNRMLGMRRAEAVKAYLVQGGMTEGRVRTVSYGESEDRQVVAGARGPGQTGWENRRVVLVIDHDGRPPAGVTTEEMLGVAASALVPGSGS